MSSQLTTQLRKINESVNDLFIDDEKAREFESLINKSIEIIQKLHNPSNDFFEIRRRAALHNLEYDLGRHISRYWKSDVKVERISEFSRARNDVNHVLNSILALYR